MDTDQEHIGGNTPGEYDLMTGVEIIGEFETVGRKGKKKKNLSHDIRGALRTKRKAAEFIQKAEKINQFKGDMRRQRFNFPSDSDPDEVVEVLDDDDEQVGTQETLKSKPLTSQIDLERLSMDSDEDEETRTTCIPHMRQFSNGVLYRKLNCNSILVSIEPYRRLYFAGKALVQVIKGTVNVYGYQFGADGNKYAVFSAKGHSSLVYIEALTRNGEGEAPTEDIEFDSGGVVSKEEFHTAVGSLVVIEGFESEWCEGFRSMYPQAVNYIGPSITGMGPGNLPQPSVFMDKLGFQFLNGAKTKHVKYLDFPTYFEELFGDIVNKYDCSKRKICPFGGKGVGKSTFVRWLTNRFLCSGANKVLFIDLDPGQTEFTPPGVLSVHICTDPILGPNFTHLKDPLKAVFIGGVNVADYPVSYVKGVVDLINYCTNQSDLQDIPWVINTMGFSKGLGVNLACEIIKISRPHCVIQLNIDDEKRSFPFYLNKENVEKRRTHLSHSLPAKFNENLEDYVFLAVNSPCNETSIRSGGSGWGVAPKVSRELTLISYFADMIGNTEDCSILSVIPQCIPLDSIAIGSINSNLTYDEILATLNGNLVALCEMPASTFTTVPGTQRKFTKNAGNFVNNFLGYGIVRAIDKKSTVLYLLATLDETDRAKVNVVLGAGAVGLPVSFYAPAGSSSKKSQSSLPYVMKRNEGTSTLHTAAKKFFVPKRVIHPILKNSLL